MHPGRCVQAGKGGTDLRIVDANTVDAEGTIVWFARQGSKSVTEKNFETELAAGVVVGPAAVAFRALFAQVFLPMLAAQEGWGQASQQHVTDFLQVPSASRYHP
jgi:hypothetical protein